MSRTLSATRRVALTAVLAAVTLGVAGCGTDTAGETGSSPAATPLTVEDGWVKAVDASEMSPMASMSPSASASPMDMSSASPSGGMDGMDGMDMSMPMTAMFGTLRNTSGSALTVTGGSSPLAGKVELHETVKTDTGAMQMQQKQGGFTIPAGGTFVLEPGANHVMLMDLAGPVPNGSQASVTLTTSAGEVTLTVPVRAFSGAEESYAPSPAS